MQPRAGILKTLAYFDLFDYPLSEEEILFFLDLQTEPDVLNASLENLLKTGCIHRLGVFYSLRNDPLLAERRVKANGNAQRLLVIATRISRFLFRFPYVRGIGISGSLSKNCADDQADIDYFIITKSNRLWIARTLMHLFKKLSFLTGHQDWYCMNYYVDERALRIKEENIFTAMELITLLPVCGNGVLEEFFDANDWVISFLHSYGSKKERIRVSHPRSLFKSVTEYLLDNKMGDRLDDFLLTLTTRRWKEKTGKKAMNKKGDPISLQTDKHFSRSDPTLLQGRILSVFDNRIKGLKAKWPDHFN